MRIVCRIFGCEVEEYGAGCRRCGTWIYDWRIHPSGNGLAKSVVPVLLVDKLQSRLVLSSVRRMQEAYGVYEEGLLLGRVL